MPNQLNAMFDLARVRTALETRGDMANTLRQLADAMDAGDIDILPWNFTPHGFHRGGTTAHTLITLNLISPIRKQISVHEDLPNEATAMVRAGGDNA